MFDLLSKPDFSSEFQPSLPSTDLNSDHMKDSRGTWMGRLNDDANGGLYKMCQSDAVEDDGLELSLGLAVGGFSFTAKKAPKLSKESSGNYSLFKESADPSRLETSKDEPPAVEQPLPVDVHALQSMSYLKNDQRGGEDASSQSRDQVWQSLQKRNFLSHRNNMHVEGAAALQELRHASASLWGRRAISLQPLMSMKEGNEGAPHNIRRLSSHGAPMKMRILPQQFDCAAPAPLSREVSSVESPLEKSPDTSTPCPQRHEALERQMKIEQQALRRQEARRRRKCLIVEKQNKKARKDDRYLALDPRTCASTSPRKISPACADPQDNSLPSQCGDVHNRLSSRESLPTTADMPGSIQVPRIGGENDHGGNPVPEFRLKPLDLAASMDRVVEREAVCASVDEHSMEREVLAGRDSGADFQPYRMGVVEQNCIIQEKARVIRPSSALGVVSVQKPVTLAQERDFPIGINEVTGKTCNSSSSESESGDTNEGHSVIQNECGEFDALSSKYASNEGSQSVGSGLSFASVNSLAYPPPFPVLPIPYPVPVAGAAPTAIPLQLGFSLPCFMQYPTAGGAESSNPSSQVSTSFPVHGSATLPPYRFPLPDGSYPWFPIVPASGATPVSAPAPSSKGPHVVKSPSNDCKGENSEGKRLEDSEMSIPAESSSPPTKRAISKSLAKEQRGSLLPSSPKQVDCQPSAPVSQRKNGKRSNSQHGRKKDGSCLNGNVSSDKQRTLPVSNSVRLLDSGTVGQSSFGTLTEERSSHSQGGELLCENEPRPGKLRRAGSKNLSSGLKQDEVSAESQLASENSGQDGSIEQPVMVDGQPPASIPELPLVSTTGVGPNGKTISGVMYISSGRQIRLVCSCHGKNMSPAEFVEHSGSIDLTNPERNIRVNPFPFLSQVATTPV